MTPLKLIETQAFIDGQWIAGDRAFEVLDPATGEPWGTSQAVAVTFDLDARKVVPVTDAAQAALAARAVADLAL